MTLSSDTLSEIRSCMQRVLRLTDTEAFALSMETTPATLPSWTSMAHLELILAVEQQLDITFEADEIANLASVAAMVAAVNAKRGASR